MTIPNQAPDSSVAGFLQPTQPEPDWQISAGSLDDYLQQMVAGVAGLDGSLVRPRWQPEPPNLPDWATDWCATGITRRRPIGAYSAQLHDCENDTGGPGHNELQRHEEFDLMCSFYGPNCDVYASNLHDGLQIWQNYAALRLSGMALVEVQETLRVPELIKQRWWDRCDKTLVLRRIIRRNYPILNVLSAGAEIVTDGPSGYTVIAAAPWPTP